MTIDQIVNFIGAVPYEITVEDKSLMEQVKMIQELEAEEKRMVFKMVDISDNELLIQFKKVKCFLPIRRNWSWNS